METSDRTIKGVRGQLSLLEMLRGLGGGAVVDISDQSIADIVGIINTVKEVGNLDFVSGRIYGATNLVDLGAGAAVMANRLYLTPIKITKRSIFESMGFRHTVDAGGSVVRCGIYENNDGYPETLIAQTSDIDTSSGAVTGKSAAFIGGDITLDPSWYWLALVSNGTPSVHSMSASDNRRDLGFADYNDSAGRMGYYTLTTFSVTGVLPETLLAGDLSITTSVLPDTRIKVK